MLLECYIISIIVCIDIQITFLCLKPSVLEVVRLAVIFNEFVITKGSGCSPRLVLRPLIIANIILKSDYHVIPLKQKQPTER